MYDNHHRAQLAYIYGIVTVGKFSDLRLPCLVSIERQNFPSGGGLQPYPLGKFYVVKKQDSQSRPVRFE